MISHILERWLNPTRRPAEFSLVVAWLCVVSATFAQVAHPPPPAPLGPYREDRILIKLKAGWNPEDVGKLHNRLRTRVRHHFRGFEDVQVIELPLGGGVREHLDEYKASGLVEYAEPDYWVSQAALPNDPGLTNGGQWHLSNTGQSGGLPGADIDAVGAWDTINSTPNVIVAMVDTGLLSTHEDLAPNLWINPGEIPGNGIDDDGDGIVDDVHGINAAANSGDISDPVGHGTMIAGFIGAVGNNGIGAAGVSWNVQLMSCRYVDNTGAGSLSDVLQCFDYARIKGAKVINASFVSTNYSSTFHSALSACRSAGIVVVAAAGNSGTDNDIIPNYPSADTLDNIIAVAATDRFDTLASYSCYGVTSVDIGVPGSEVMSTMSHANNGYGTSSGTSFSTAIMSGAMALMRARYPSDTPAQLIQRVLNTVDPLPSLAGKCVSGGRLNLARALGPSVIASFSESPAVGTPPLAVRFTDTSYGNIAQWAWDFGDGRTSSLQNPSHIYGSTGDYTVVLTATGANGHVSTTNLTVFVEANYQISAGTYTWIDPTSMPQLALSLNGVSPAQSLPFPFEFYGHLYNSIFVGANGVVGFNAAGLGATSNTDLPNTAQPNNMICAFWDALNPGPGSSIHVGTTGVAPNRMSVISWVGISTAGTRATTLSFQVVLLESSNEILLQYQDVSPTSRSASAAGKSATIGLEDASGLVAARYSYNGSTLLANNTAVLFAPPISSRLAVLPAGGLSSSGIVGGPFSPASITYTLTNTGTASLNWTAAATQSWVALSATAGSLAPGATATVIISIGTAANSLAVASYSDTVTFSNTSNGNGDTSRSVWLRVLRLPFLSLIARPNPSLVVVVVHGDAGVTYVLQKTEDFQTWESVGTNAAGIDGTVTFEQPVDPMRTARFFRALLGSLGL